MELKKQQQKAGLVRFTPFLLGVAMGNFDSEVSHSGGFNRLSKASQSILKTAILFLLWRAWPVDSEDPEREGCPGPRLTVRNQTNYEAMKKYIPLYICLIAAIWIHPSEGAVLPHRVLVVVGDQWNDPSSYNIDETRVNGDEFRDVVTMLKVWGVPFDVLRLDQQNLQINRFLNGVGEPNYGCIIWMADPTRLEGAHAEFPTLRRVVEDYGISLIALFDFVKSVEIGELVGIEYEDYIVTNLWYPEERYAITETHFLTAGMKGMEYPENVNTLEGSMPQHHTYRAWTVQCREREGTQVLARLGGYPQLVAQVLEGKTRTVWLGGERDWFRSFPSTRKIFRRALVWCMGYGIFNDNFEDAFILVMDDMGASEHAYSVQWHYPTPSKERILKYLVEPLEEYGAMMVQNVTPGFANPKTRMVDPPWRVEKFTDPFGQIQDYGSTKEGLDEGLKRGVFEIQTHRAWTHVTPDLESPPGPWWDAPVKGELSHPSWYEETYDQRRDRPVPSSDMLFVYKVGRDAIERQFGVTPLAVSVRPSRDLDHDNARLAAIAGYGISWVNRYLGTDLSIQFSIPELLPGRFTGHDLDLAKAPELPRKWIEANRDKR